MMAATIKKKVVDVDSRRPLAGKRIIVTRARAQASALAQALEELGAEIIEFPTIEIQPPQSYGALDEAIARIQSYDWLIFTSVNGVESFLARLAFGHKRVDELAGLKIGAIGPETAKRLEAAGFGNCLVPKQYQAEGILDLLSPQAMRGRRVLIPRAAKARDILPETLRQWGAAVDVVEAYRTAIPMTDSAWLKDVLDARRVDMITFTSSSTVSNFVRLFPGQKSAQLLANAAIACIGPITRQTVEDLGGSAAVVSEEFTIPGLVRAVLDYFTRPTNAGGGDVSRSPTS